MSLHPRIPAAPLGFPTRPGDGDPVSPPPPGSPVPFADGPCRPASITPETIREVVLVWLLGSADLAELVDDRIHVDVLPQDRAFPAVSFSLSTRSFGSHLRGHDGVSVARFQVSAWAYTSVEAERAALAAQERLRGLGGYVGSIEVLRVRLEDESSLPEPRGGASGDWLYRIITPVSIAHRLPPPPEPA